MTKQECFDSISELSDAHRPWGICRSRSFSSKVNKLMIVARIVVVLEKIWDEMNEYSSVASCELRVEPQEHKPMGENLSGCVA